MLFSPSNFLVPTVPADHIIKLRDVNGIRVGGFNICHCQKLSAEDTQLWIVVPEGKIVLPFTTQAEAQTALAILEVTIETLLPNCLAITATTTDNLPEGVTNLYFTTERAQDAVGNILTNTTNIAFTYNDALNTISADLSNTGVTIGSYTNANITVDAKGRITAASSGATGLTIGTTAITSGAINRVLFEGTGNVLQENANFVFNSTSQFLGIGLGSPTANLHVSGTLRFVTGNQANNKVLTSDASGNADWQTISSITGLVDGSGTTDYIVKWVDGPNSEIGDGSWAFSGSTIYPTIDGSDIGLTGTNRVGTIYMASTIDYASELAFNEAGTERMRIGVIGNVGIGTATPSFKLDVSGGSTTSIAATSYSNVAGSALVLGRARGTSASPTALTSGSSIGTFRIRGYGVTAFLQHTVLTTSATEAWTDSAQGWKMTFSTGANGSTSDTVRMTIGQDGAVGIGQLSPVARLDVKGFGSTSATYSFKVENSSSTLFFGVKDNGVIFSGNPGNQDLFMGSGFSDISGSTAGNVGVGINVFNGVLTGTVNTAFGSNVGSSITSGGYNTLVGRNVGNLLTSGQQNTGLGLNVMDTAIVTGNNNVGIGVTILTNLTSGIQNIAIGNTVSTNITYSNYSVGIGNSVLVQKISGDYTVAIGGISAGRHSTTGSRNIFIGSSTEVSDGTNLGPAALTISDVLVIAGYDSTVYTANTAIFGGNQTAYNDFYFGKGQRNSAPNDVTFHVTDRYDNINPDLTGANFKYAAGAATGNAAGGYHSWLTSDAGISGTATQMFSEKMRLDVIGRLGVGTTSPTANLHISGTFRLVDGNQASGRILTSDATGNATWQAPGVNSGGIKKTILLADNVTNLSYFQYLVYGDLTVEGQMANQANGEVALLNGDLVLDGGTFTNSGTLNLVDLQTGIENDKGYSTDFTTVANIPLTITHNLGTSDVIFSIKEGLNFVAAQVNIVDTNNVTITTTSAVTGRINIIGII